MSPAEAVDDILALFRLRGAERYGERVTQLDHALQCASLAAEAGAADSLVAAALLHDYGHLIDDRGHMAERDGLDGEHEAVGARALAAWFGPQVTQPVALHVAAKRYLCATSPGYLEALSPASRLQPGAAGRPARAGRGGRLRRPAVRRRRRAPAPLGRLGQGHRARRAAAPWRASARRCCASLARRPSRPRS